MGATSTGVLLTLLGCAVAVLVVVLLVVVRGARRRAAEEHTRRERLEEELALARTDVVALGRRLDELGHDVVEARRTAEQAAARSDRLTSRPDREFVITSLGDADAPQPATPEGTRWSTAGAPGLRRPAAVLEDRLVHVASRRSASPTGAAAARLLVQAAALGHGVRRAFSPEVLDRAAAEATVARRRSRRDRKRELREARRFLRTVQERPSGKHVA